MTAKCAARPGTDYEGVPLPEDYVQKLNAIDAKRARTVIQYLLTHGTITTDDLKELGYEHAPRAVRDVRELGFGLKTFRVPGADGKNIAMYAFDKPNAEANKLSKKLGRTVLSEELKDKLIARYGNRCFITLVEIDKKDLQVDHRIPYEIGGEPDHNDLTRFMLLSGSSNRRKSWTCEHCSNWQRRDVDFCKTCFWAYPENYTHVADEEERIIMLTFTGSETEAYDRMRAELGDKAEVYYKTAIIKRFAPELLS